MLLAVPPWLLSGTLPAAEPAADQGQVTEGLINAPTAEVWRLFTTSDGFKATGAAHAEVDLRIGGSIRSHYDPKGQLGDPETIVNEILAYEPERMLAIRIRQAPASFPYRQAIDGTWTVLYFTPAGADMTLVRIVGLGYRDDASSQAMREFFRQGNRQTLDELAKRYRPKCKLCEKEEKAGKEQVQVQCVTSDAAETCVARSIIHLAHHRSPATHHP